MKQFIEKLKEQGYILEDEKNAKLLYLFSKKREIVGKNISTMLLEGMSGAGKTALAEAFNGVVEGKEIFLQCFRGIDSDNLIIEPNISAIIKKDSDNAISKGALVRALIESHKHPVTLIIDEIDKADAAFDCLLLDFINSGRVTDGINEWRKGNFPIWVFLTSNGERDLSDALLNRVRKVTVERMSKKSFLNALHKCL